MDAALGLEEDRRDTLRPGFGPALVASVSMRFEVARAYAVSKLGWIRNQQATLLRQAREASDSGRSLYDVDQVVRFLFSRAGVGGLLTASETVVVIARWGRPELQLRGTQLEALRSSERF